LLSKSAATQVAALFCFAEMAAGSDAKAPVAVVLFGASDLQQWFKTESASRGRVFRI
jgi:hypothetical protein